MDKLDTEWIYSNKLGSTPRASMRVYKSDSPCILCSNDEFLVKHHHVSTKYITRRFSCSRYFCPFCRFIHKNLGDFEGRKRVILGSSTLHNVWKTEDFKPSAHIDFEIIIGGKIHDVNACFLYQWSSSRTPLDIVLACGVNNIPIDGHLHDTAEDIIFQYKTFVDYIKLHSAGLKEGIMSRVVIATIPYAPKHTDRSLASSSEMVDKVRKVNAWIVEFNEGCTGLQLRLDLHGVVGDPGAAAGKAVVHRYIDWQEPQIEKKLHLNKEVKKVIGKQLVQVFNDLQKINNKEVFSNLQKANNNESVVSNHQKSSNNNGAINNLQKTSINIKGMSNIFQKTQVSEIKKVEECIVSRARVCEESNDKSSRLAMKYKAVMEF